MTPALQDSEKKTHFLVLQAWRALAAFLVMAGHVNNEALSYAQQKGLSYPLGPYPSAVGVDMFFVISGFVIVYASKDLIGKASSAKFFITRRLIRIVPLYWFYTSLMLAVAFILPQAFDTARPTVMHLIQSYFFIPHIRPYGDAIRPFLALGWSLNYEMYFYLLFAILIFLPLGRLMTALSFFLCTTVLIGIFIPKEMVALNFWFDPYVLEFLGGSLMAYAYLKGYRLPKIAFWPMTMLGFAILLYIFVPEPYSTEGQVLRFFVSLLFVAAAVLPRDIELMKPPKVFVELGNSSYSLYLSHPFVMGAIELVFFRTGLDLIWYFIISIIACTVAGHISYLMVENPVQKFLVSRLNEKKYLKEKSA